MPRFVYIKTDYTTVRLIGSSLPSRTLKKALSYRQAFLRDPKVWMRGSELTLESMNGEVNHPN